MTTQQEPRRILQESGPAAGRVTGINHIVLFTRDLRVHDNPALVAAIVACVAALCFYKYLAFLLGSLVVRRRARSSSSAVFPRPIHASPQAAASTLIAATRRNIRNWVVIDHECHGPRVYMTRQTEGESGAAAARGFSPGLHGITAAQRR